MFLLTLLTLAWQGSALTNYQAKFEARQAETGYSTIRYDLDHHAVSIPLTVHAHMGCVLEFSRPYDDVWASDGKGQGGNGAFYKYAEWGTDARGQPNYRRIVVSSVLHTDTTQNLFLLFGDAVVEFTLKQTKDAAVADRRVALDLVGGVVRSAKEPAPKTETPRADDPLNAALARVVGPGNRTVKVPHGTLVYRFEQGARLVYFTPNEGAPATVTLEVIRGVRRGEQFKYEMPLRPELDRNVGRARLLTFPNFELEKGERLYFRIKVEGERTAKIKRLKRHKSRWRF